LKNLFLENSTTATNYKFELFDPKKFHERELAIATNNLTANTFPIDLEYERHYNNRFICTIKHADFVSISGWTIDLIEENDGNNQTFTYDIGNASDSYLVNNNYTRTRVIIKNQHGVEMYNVVLFE